MTPAQFKIRYPWAASIADATIQVYLTDAEADLGPAGCWGTSWDRAVGLLAAHRMTLAGLNPTNQGATLSAQGLQSVKSGTLALTVSNQVSASGYQATDYGQQLLDLGRRVRGAGPLVAGGCIAPGGVGTSPYVKDAPFWSLPNGIGGQ